MKDDELIPIVNDMVGLTDEQVAAEERAMQERAERTERWLYGYPLGSLKRSTDTERGTPEQLETD